MQASLAHALMRLVAEQDAQLQATAVSTFMDLLGKRAKLPEVLLQVQGGPLGPSLQCMHSLNSLYLHVHGIHECCVSFL